MKKRIFVFISVFLAATIVLAVLLTANYFNILPRKKYQAEDFDIKVIKSNIDFNNNGIDDYTDILTGARKDAK
ncbi:MAG: DUF1287 domain-containing protein, partial [Clostridia bacterium]|nr:DUF1287 domain-containing protein [Clostridia bacterium]